MSCIIFCASFYFLVLNKAGDCQRRYFRWTESG